MLKFTTPTLQHISYKNGKIAYREMGEGPVLFLLHGMNGNSQSWANLFYAVSSTVHEALKLKYLEKIKKSPDGRRNEYLPTKPMLEAWQNYCNALLVNPKFEHALSLAQTVILTRESAKLISKKIK